MLHLILMLNTMKILTEKILNLNLVIVLQYQNTKAVLLMDIPKTGMKKFLSLAKLKIQFHGLMLLVIYMVKRFMELFMKRNCKKLVSKNSE